MATGSLTSDVLITTNSGTDSQVSSFVSHTRPQIQALGPAASVAYIYSTPPSLTLSDNADLSYHLAAAASGPPFAFFPAAGGSAIGYLNFDPNPVQEEGYWHRTQTVDYIVILEGELELSLSGGKKRVVKKGDVVIQRAPMHRWKNLSKTEGARFACVALGTEAAVQGDIEFGENT